MTTTLRTRLSLLLLAPLMVFEPSGASAQTPAQMEYERQAREARQAQERAQQEQQRLQQLQNDNARRQQEEINRSIRQSTPSPQSPQHPSTPGEGRPSTAQNICKAKPVRAGERNPLIGQWRYVGSQGGTAT